MELFAYGAFFIYGGQPGPLIFLKFPIYESLFKMTFHVVNCFITCQPEQVNRCLLIFLHAKCSVNVFRTA